MSRTNAPPQLIVIAVAGLWTVFAAFEPLGIDDAAYEQYARQIARDPLDPYGFEIHWYDQPEPAHGVLAPPVLPYWLALVRTVGGEDPWVWKLAMFPWALLLTAAVWHLARRFVPGREDYVTAFIVASPALLPSLHLMLDVPALGLSLAAVGVFLEALSRPAGAAGLGRVVLAGVLAGLACQTKYTGFLASAAILLAAGLARRPLRGLGAAGLAGALFVAWEAFTSWRYGASHFLTAAAGSQGLWARLTQLPFLPNHLGGLGAAAVLLGLGAWPGRWVRWLGGGLLALCLLVVPLWDLRVAVGPGPDWPVVGPIPNQRFEFQPGEVANNLVALGLLVLAGVAARAVWREEASPGKPGPGAGAFLVLWLGLELVGYAALTPFPAARRVLGVWVVLVLLLARWVSLSAGGRAGLPRAALVAQLVLAGVFCAVDWRDTYVQAEGARAGATLARPGPDETVWTVGHWGWTFYAERAGMRGLIPGASVVRAGDWLVLPDAAVDQQGVEFPATALELIDELVYADPVPLRTMSNYYGGRLPLENHQGPRLRVRVYRARRDFAALEGPPAGLFPPARR